MIAALKPITSRPIERPAFDNRRIANKRCWVSDNTGLLARYLHELTQGLSPEERTPMSNPDLRAWLNVQYELELVYHERARLPHGAAL